MRQPDNTCNQLACEGGTPVRCSPFAAWPVFDDEMIEAATTVLKSGKVNYWTGEQTKHFEREFADFVGSKYGIATANGTLALELALQALGVGAGDEVIVPSRTFIASASCAVMRGATPVVADIDCSSQNLTIDSIRAVLTPRAKAIIAVHLAGWPCDMDPIMELARQHGLWVIEDCAQAHGATYKGRMVGSMGDAAAFSFCQDKIMTTAGEGGMLTTNNEATWRSAWSFKDHGKSWDAVHRASSGEVFRWLHEGFGTNWRMTEVQSAIGRVALRHLPKWLEHRRQNAAVLTEGLSKVSAISTFAPPPHVSHSYYKYYAFLRSDLLRPDWSRDRFVRALQAEGIPCGSGACPEIHRELAFVNSGLGPKGPLPAATELGATSLMLPVHPTLTVAELRDICVAVKKVATHATTSEMTSLRGAA